MTGRKRPGARRATLTDLPGIMSLQHAAYEQNRRIMGVEPLPLRADYSAIFAGHECWVVDGETALDGALILELRPDDLLIWSVATHPRARSRGLGNDLLLLAEERARETGRVTLRLYTSEKLTGNIAWYARRGYAVERLEQMPDRRAVHMKKVLGG